MNWYQMLRRHGDWLVLLAALLLVNYWISPQVVLIGVAWTLAVEMMFYALILATHALGRRPALRLAECRPRRRHRGRPRVRRTGRSRWHVRR